MALAYPRAPPFPGALVGATSGRRKWGAVRAVLQAACVTAASGGLQTVQRAREAIAVAAINNLFTNLLNIGLGVGVTVAAFFLMWGAFMVRRVARG